MQYIEIQSLEKHAEKIEKQLNIILATKPGIYAKTKDKYKKLALSLLQSAKKISSILEEESLVPFPEIEDEFEELSNASHQYVDDSLQEAISEVHQSIDNCSEFTESGNIPSSPRPSSLVLSNKDIVSRFASVVSEGSSSSFNNYVDAVNCAVLINKWMQHRFFPKIKNTQFRYKLNQLPNWITYIIIAYGKYMQMDRREDFMDIVDRWVIEIENNPSNTYALPYEVFEFMKSTNSDDFTMEAVLLGDLLMEECYHKLTEPYMSGSSIYLDCFPVADVVKSRNISLLPIIRSRLANQDELLQKYNFSKLDL